MSQQRPPDRASALELLRSQHTFPGRYVFRVVVQPSASASIVTAVAAALASNGVVDHVEEQPSRTGKYVSLRIHTDAKSAELVLEVYAVIGKLDGVLMTL